MKRVFLIFTILYLATGISSGQIDLNKAVNRSVNKAERSIENRVERRIDNGVDKSLDAVEEGIDDSVNRDGKDKNNDGDKKSDNKMNVNPDDKSDTSNSDNGSKSKNTDNQPAPQEPEKQNPVLTWAKYDFVPGTEIIFEDNLENEQNGEFPSRWDLKSGNIENASLDGQNVIYFMKCNVNGGGESFHC